jgi:CTD small phosphatase-like protein 2
MIDISSIINNKNLPNQNFTLILELNETIISIKKDNKGKVIIIPRPGLTQFLKEISKLYEIIIFTTFDKNYADQIINSIDKKNRYFEKRLYKEHTIFINNIYIKDLSQLKRDLSKVIIIDNKPQNFELQKENGIYIRSFNGNKNDNVLLDLINILKKIACNNENDVRNEIKKLYNEIFSKITTDLNERTN